MIPIIKNEKLYLKYSHNQDHENGQKVQFSENNDECGFTESKKSNWCSIAKVIL